MTAAWKRKARSKSVTLMKTWENMHCARLCLLTVYMNGSKKGEAVLTVRPMEGLGRRWWNEEDISFEPVWKALTTNRFATKPHGEHSGGGVVVVHVRLHFRPAENLVGVPNSCVRGLQRNAAATCAGQ